MGRIADSLIYYIPGGKYDSARDAFLDYMVSQGWANESSGDVESSAGHFALIKNPPAEVAEIVQAFSEEMNSLDIVPIDLTGYFVVETNSAGDVTVHDFDSEMAAEIVYSEFEREYDNWMMATGD